MGQSKLDNSLKKSFNVMSIQRENKKMEKLRKRCNRCGYYVHINNTVKIKYKNNNSRTYRICKNCNDILKKEVYE